MVKFEEAKSQTFFLKNNNNKHFKNDQTYKPKTIINNNSQNAYSSFLIHLKD